MLHGHGDNAYLYDKEIEANFSSNVYFKGTSQRLIQHLKKQLENIGNYPEVASESLNQQIAQFHGLKQENILVTNGATEAFYLLALLFKSMVSDIFVPSFAEYADACKLHRHKINYINNELITTIHTSDAHLVWLCNPNNPDGKIIEPKELEIFITANKKSQIILDEAYTDFTIKNISLIDKIKELENLIIVRSLTKKYAIPGLRLGYIAASEKVIKNLMQVKEPWSVNSIAIEAGKFLLKEEESYFDIAELMDLSFDFQKDLAEIHGIEVIPSQTSFFLVKLQKSATKTVEYLVNEHGLLVRNASNFKNLDDSCIRISTRSKKDNTKLVKALKIWMKQ